MDATCSGKQPPSERELLQLQQGLSPLQIAMDRNYLSVAKLLRQSQHVFSPAAGLQAHAQALSSHGAYPFKDTDGLQRYTDEVTRYGAENTKPTWLSQVDIEIKFYFYSWSLGT